MGDNGPESAVISHALFNLVFERQGDTAGCDCVCWDELIVFPPVSCAGLLLSADKYSRNEPPLIPALHVNYLKKCIITM